MILSLDHVDAKLITSSFISDTGSILSESSTSVPITKTSAFSILTNLSFNCLPATASNALPVAVVVKLFTINPDVKSDCSILDLNDSLPNLFANFCKVSTSEGIADVPLSP